MTRMVMFLWLAGLSLYDIRFRRVPVWLVLTGGMMIAGLGICGCISGGGGFLDCLWGMAPGAVLLLLAIGTRKAGWVDGIVLMLVGGILRLRQCILAAMTSLILISILSALLLVFRKAGRGTKIPYLPFLTVGVIICGITGG